MILQNTEPTIKIGPIHSRDLKMFGRQRLFENEVLFSLNSSPLSPVPGAKGYKRDLDGFFDIEIPKEYTKEPGILTIIVKVDGHPTFSFEYKVDEEFTQVTPGDIDVVIAKLNELSGNVSQKEQVIGLQTALSQEIDKNEMLNGRLDEIVKSIKALDKEPTQCLAGGLDEKVGDLSKKVSELTGSQDQTALVLENLDHLLQEFVKIDLGKEVKGSLVPMDLASREHVIILKKEIDKVSDQIKALKPLKQKDITGHDGPLDTKNGRVLLSQGRDDGQIDLVNGQTLARDVADKTGWVLGASGFEAITSKIEQIVKKLLPSKKPFRKK